MISEPQITFDSDVARWSVGVHQPEAPDRELWFEVPLRYADMLTARSDPALAALLIKAMQERQDLAIEGDLSSELAAQAADLVHVVSIALGLPPISVVHARAVAPTAPASGMATGFSGGIDSFMTLLENLDPDAQGQKLSHLLFNNVGSHGDGPTSEQLFRERRYRSRQVAEEVGLPIVSVNSNLPDWRLGTFAQVHTLANAAVALLLQGGISRFLYSSAYTYDYAGVRRTDKIAVTDPILLPLLSTRSVGLISTGGRFSRTAKTATVAPSHLAQRYLDVCTRSEASETNCSTCPKCRRTLLTLEILGAADDFDAVFDLRTWQSWRQRTMATTLAGSDAFSTEIKALADKMDFRWPMRAQLIRPAVHVKRAAKRARTAVRRS